jgi:signal transduction histidine kinase
MMLSRIWDRLPFAGRLLFTASAALLVAGLVLLYTSVRWDVREAEADLRGQLQAELQTLPPSLAEILVIGDFSTLQQVLDNQVLRRNVSGIRYRDASGTLVETRDAPIRATAPAWFAGWFSFAEIGGTAAADIGGRHYGAIEITVSAQEAINRAWLRLIQHLSILLLAIALDFLGIWLVLRSGLKPLHDLSEASKALGAGDLDVRVELSGAPELRATARAFNEMAYRINTLVGVLQEREKQLKQALEEERAARGELALLNETLEQRVQEEAARNREKDHMLIQQSRLAGMGEMIGNIAHQWRQPLNTLGLILANIKDAHDFGDMTAAYLNEATSKGNQIIQKMSTTIDDFRNFFRPNREKQVFSLNHAAREALAMVDASFRNHHVTVDWQEGEEIFTYGFPNEYSQVLLNLLGNARDAILDRRTPEGKVTVRLARDDGHARLTVRDNGGGIPAEVLPRIFDPYFTTKEKGTGIGLYMSKMIVENNMDGSIEACNIENGAEFTIVTPLAVA